MKKLATLVAVLAIIGVAANVFFAPKSEAELLLLEADKIISIVDAEMGVTE